jgi:hypothetical protein
VHTLLAVSLRGFDGAQMTPALDSTGVAAVDHSYFWQPIATCPRGVKVQLLGAGGVAMYGTYNGKDKFYTHWAPLPKLKREAA